MTSDVTFTQGNEMAATCINESGLYSLIMSSRLPYAKAFKRWVLKEVLPSIRRTGSYTQPTIGQPPPAIQTEAQQWDARRAYLDSLCSSVAFAKVVGIHLGEAHMRVFRDAINEVLLPIGDKQRDMVDAAEILRRRGHGPPEIARLAGELGRALKTAWERTNGGDVVTNRMEFGGGSNDVRLYHVHRDAAFIDAVLRVFEERELYKRVCAERRGSQLVLAQSVEEALRDGRGERKRRRTAVGPTSVVP